MKLRLCLIAYTLRTGRAFRTRINASDLPAATLDDDLPLSSCNNRQTARKSASASICFQTLLIPFAARTHAYPSCIHIKVSTREFLEQHSSGWLQPPARQNQSPITFTVYISLLPHNQEHNSALIVSKKKKLHSPPSFLCIFRTRRETFFLFICSFLCLTDLTWGLGGTIISNTTLHQKTSPISTPDTTNILPLKP